MAANTRRPAEQQPLGLCFWCDLMCFPGAVRIQGASGYLMLHSECCARLSQDCAMFSDRALAREWLGVGDELPDGEAVTA